jgi:SAM-dependent methyltransferase
MKLSLPHDAYDELAEHYDSRVETKPHNAYYDRPAVQSLVPDVSGKHILDAGCGPGVYTKWLLDRGAKVTGIDASRKMIEFARRRTARKATFIHANLEEPLTFLSDGVFDGVLSPLTVAYIKDHDALFSEFNRALRPGGWFIFSTEHPFFAYDYYNLDNYFDTTRVQCDWYGFGKVVTMPAYYHSLGALTDALTNNGFLIEKILEPKPTDQFRERDPEGYENLMRCPLFICIKARKVSDIGSLPKENR